MAVVARASPTQLGVSPTQGIMSTYRRWKGAPGNVGKVDIKIHVFEKRADFCGEMYDC